MDFYNIRNYLRNFGESPYLINHIISYRHKKNPFVIKLKEKPERDWP